MKRTDIHRPSVINPDEYEFVAFEYIKVNGLGDAIALKAQRDIIAEHMRLTGGKYSGHEHGGNCMVCGNVNALYTVLFHHKATNVYVRTGQECADKMHLAYSEGDFKAFRKRIESALEAKAGKAKAQAILSDAGLERCWTIYTAEDRAAHKSEELTICDIVGKLVKYGSISDKATDYLKSLVHRVDNRVAVEAERAAQHEAAAPCPTGRVEISGTVLAVKSSEGYAGRTETKILVQAEAGFKVWGTRTANFEKGDKVVFTATVTPSSDDPKFGFFKRPTKARLVFDNAQDNELITCPTCNGDSVGCGMCGGAHKVLRGVAKRYGCAA
jgi:hypothetical protein